MPDSEIRDNAIDYSAGAIKATLGAIPIAGSFLAELIGVVIPGQRMDRLAKYAECLGQRISKLEQHRVRGRLLNENFTDLMEESLRQAMQAVSDERRQYISALIANGIVGNDAKFVESKHILRMLGEINDIEVIWLRYYAVGTIQGDEAFRRKHTKLLQHIFITTLSTEEDRREWTIQKSYKEHLTQLGLLSHRFRKDPTTGDVQVDFHSGSRQVEDYEITLMGHMLLHEIGLKYESIY